MHAEVETIREMSETLESANFGRDQSDAFIQSVALAMKTFAVTPKVLDERLAELRREWKQDFSEYKSETNQRLDRMDNRLDQQKGAIDELKESVGGLKESVGGLKESVGGLKDSIDGLKSDVDGLKSDVDGLKDTMHSLQRSLLGYLLGFTLVILAGLLGTLGALLPP